MWFLTLISYLSLVVQISFATLAIASGLYYLAELVEEYTALSAKIIKYTIILVIFIHIGFLLFEDFSVSMNVMGIVAQVVHLCLLANFPMVQVLSPSFIVAIALLFVNHYLTFMHFQQQFYSFSEVLAYFIICLWLVPFAFFISLSANENVLPTVVGHGPSYGSTDSTGFNVDGDVVSNYFSTRKSKKYGLLPLFNYLKDIVVPERTKRFS